MKKSILISIISLFFFIGLSITCDNPWELPVKVSPENIQPPQIEWVRIPAGSFEMGDNFDEGEIFERPVHTVYLDSYYISKYEVTFEQYDLFCDATGRRKPKDNLWGRETRSVTPVINVSWEDAKAFCDWMSSKTNPL